MLSLVIPTFFVLPKHVCSQTIKSYSNGDVSVGRIFSQPNLRIFDVKGSCFSQSQIQFESQEHNNNITPTNEGANNSSVLFQNIPNPFNTETKIKYYLASSTNQAAMYIYDMNGKQIDRFELREKG